MKFGLKLVTPPEKIKQDIIKEMHRLISQNFEKYGGFLESSIGLELSLALEDSPTLESLRRGGDLAGELGVEYANVWSIINAVAHSTTVKVTKPKIVGNQIVAKMSIRAAPSDVETIAASQGDGGIQITDKGQQLPWLKWLLTLGDAVIVRDFEVRAGFPKHSRTGDKIMVDVFYLNKGGGWRVPPEHAGSEGNNFITRAIDEALPRIEKEIIDLFTDAIISNEDQ